jgi:hypothetical protein
MSLNFSITASMLAEFHAGQILVDLLHLRFLALLDRPQVGKLDQGLPQHHGDREDRLGDIETHCRGSTNSPTSVALTCRWREPSTASLDDIVASAILGEVLIYS